MDSSALVKRYVRETESETAGRLLSADPGRTSPKSPAREPLDALHLAAAHRAGVPALRIVMFDTRMAQAARGLGWTVAGA